MEFGSGRTSEYCSNWFYICFEVLNILRVGFHVPLATSQLQLSRVLLIPNCIFFVCLFIVMVAATAII